VNSELAVVKQQMIYCELRQKYASSIDVFVLSM